MVMIRAMQFVALVAIMTATDAAAQTAPAAQAAPVANGGVPLATPIGSPADWFPADAYPPEARAAGIQGRTEFKLDLDPQGRITECDIAKSSGSPLLDSTTCALLVSNARFKPAHDASGRAVAGMWSSAMVWQLATASPDVLEGFSGQTGKSPAEIYNDSVSAEQKQAQQADPHQDQGGGSSSDDQ